MEILLWLVPPAVVTVLAMGWAAWVGRDRPGPEDRSASAQQRAQQRFAEAIMREHPVPTRRTVPRDRSTGVAVRRPRRSA